MTLSIDRPLPRILTSDPPYIIEWGKRLVEDLHLRLGQIGQEVNALSSSGGVPGASYLVLSNDATLTAERALTMGVGLSALDGGANSIYILNLDISTLPAEPTLASGDRFPFVDVSVATGAIGQRYVTFTNLATQINALGGGGAGTVTDISGGVGITNSSEPITTSGTVDLDINSLTSETTVAVGDLLPFVDISVGTTPASQRKMTVSNLITTVGAAMPIAGGVGITNTPEPIVGAGGTVDLDINSLTTQTAVASGDLLPFVDISVGTTPASQRKMSVTNLTTAVGALMPVAGGVGITNTPEPIVGAGGTVDLDLNTLTTETALATGDLFGFVDISVGTTPASQRKVTFGNVAAGLNTLGTLDHGNMTGLADDDHSQYLLLAGRTGTTNNYIVSTTQDGIGIGSAASGGDYYLRSTSHATKGALRLDDTQVWWESQTNFVAGTNETRIMAQCNPTFSSTPNAGITHNWRCLQVDPTATMGDAGGFNLGGNLTGVHFAPTSTITGGNVVLRGMLGGGTHTATVGPTFGGFALFVASPTLQTSVANTGIYTPIMYLSSANLIYAASSGTGAMGVTFGAHAFSDLTTVSASVSGGALTVDNYISYSTAPTFSETAGATLTISYRKGYRHGACSASGTGTSAVTKDAALYIENGPSIVAAQYALGFNAAIGTHKAVASPGAIAVTIGTGPTGSTAGNPQGWIKIDVNGTDRYIPFW